MVSSHSLRVTLRTESGKGEQKKIFDMQPQEKSNRCTANIEASSLKTHTGYIKCVAHECVAHVVRSSQLHFPPLLPRFRELFSSLPHYIFSVPPLKRARARLTVLPISHPKNRHPTALDKKKQKEATGPTRSSAHRTAPTNITDDPPAMRAATAPQQSRCH